MLVLGSRYSEKIVIVAATVQGIKPSIEAQKTHEDGKEEEGFYEGKGFEEKEKL